jgi:integrase
MHNDWELTPEKYLNAEELSRLLRKAEELFVIGEAKSRKSYVRDWMIIHTALFTGLRRAEICNLKVADLRIANGQSHVIVRTRKGGKTNQVVHVGHDYKRTLRKYLQWKMRNGELTPDAYLLRTARTEKFSVSGLWLRWKLHCPKKLHSARHTFATMTYQATKDLRLLQKQLSHSRITTTQIYADVTPDQICVGMDAMERLTRAVCKIRPENPVFLSMKQKKGGEIGSGDSELAPSGTRKIERNGAEITESLDDFTG